LHKRNDHTAIAGAADVDLNLTEQLLIRAAPAAVFALSIDAARFPGLFRGCGPIPALREVRLHAPAAVGVTRDVESSDGSCMTETITALVPDQRHAYTLSGIGPPLSWLVRTGHADWTFVATTEGTRVTWHYRFALTTPLVAPLAAPLLQIFMRTAMRRCLAAMAKVLESPN
jgi:carbon monoxide dehydrogenase subunit G